MSWFDELRTEREGRKINIPQNYMECQMRIPLTRAQFAIIDDSDAALISGFSWHANPNRMGGYYALTAARGADGKRATLYMHRIITGAPKGKVVDHINHDTLDNRRCNLRVGSQKDNMQNGARALTTHCPRGHEYSEKNTHVNKKGSRICRACARNRVAAIYAAQTPEQKAARLKRNNDRYWADYERRRAMQNEYSACHREQKRAYDIAYRPIKNERRRAQTGAVSGR